ncbi:MAG TPA: AzlD domain-containing protein [Kribbellaceae bacterium]|nr:AzlD domain-containing protein [Kribbellaceae bacterium]
MSRLWVAVLAAGAGCYLLKLLGLSIPHGVLEKPVVRRIAALLPVALLAALVGVQTFGSGRALTVDARLAGLAAAVTALLLRAPFLVVVLAAAATTALLRLAL